MVRVFKQFSRNCQCRMHEQTKEKQRDLTPQPAHNIVSRLILGREVEQAIFNVETMLLISTSGKQPIFNVETTLDFNAETTSDFNVETS